MNKPNSTYRALCLTGLLCLLLAPGLAGCQAKVQQDAAAPQIVQPVHKDQQLAATPQGVTDTQQDLQAASLTNPADDHGYAEAVMLRSPQFTETELLKIFKDMEPVSHDSMYNVVEYLHVEKGWPMERSYYILTKVASSEGILQDGDSARQYLRENWPEDMPTNEELALVEKHRAALHKLIGYQE